jgi:HEAT repeat protein
VVVACCAVVALVAQRLWENQRPVIAAARGLKSPKPSDRAQAVRELMMTGASDPVRAVSPLLAALGDQATEVRVAVAEALGVVGEAAITSSAGGVARTAVAALIRSLKDREPAVQVAATQALARMAGTPNAAPAIGLNEIVAALASTLSSGDESARLLVLSALARFWPLVSDEPPGAVVAALKDPSAKVRVAALTALSRSPRPLDPWLGLLLQTVEHEEPQDALKYSFAFNRNSPPAFSSVVIPALVEALGSRNRIVRFCAVRALEPHAGQPRVAAVLIPALLALLIDPIGPGPADRLARENYVTIHAARMLGRIAPGTRSAGVVITALTGAVESAEQAQWQPATEALAAFGPAAEPAIPALVRNVRTARRSEDRIILFKGRLAAGSLAKIAPGTKSAGEAIAALTEVVQSPHIPHRTWAAEALARFGPAADLAIPALVQYLRETLESKDPGSINDTHAVVGVLSKVAPGTKSAGEAIAALIGVVRSPHTAGRDRAAECLGDFGPAAEPAVPTLIDGLREAVAGKGVSPSFGWSAARALGRIAPKTKSADAALAALTEAALHGRPQGPSRGHLCAGGLRPEGRRHRPPAPRLAERLGPRPREVRDRRLEGDRGRAGR